MVVLAMLAGTAWAQTAQSLLASMDYVPSNMKVASPMKGIRIQLVDPAVTLDQLDKWTKIFNSTLGKRGPS